MVHCNPSKCGGEPTSQRSRRLSKRCRCGEPIYSGDHQTDEPRDCRRRKAQAAKNRKDKGKCRNSLRQPLRRTAPLFDPDSERSKIKHEMGKRRTKDSTDTLNHNVRNNFAPWRVTTRGENKRHSWIEVS